MQTKKMLEETQMLPANCLDMPVIDRGQLQPVIIRRNNRSVVLPPEEMAILRQPGGQAHIQDILAQLAPSPYSPPLYTETVYYYQFPNPNQGYSTPSSYTEKYLERVRVCRALQLANGKTYY